MRHVVMECGFLPGNRGQGFGRNHTPAIVYGQLNGCGAQICPTIKGRGERWYEELKERNSRDSHQNILILGQVPYDSSLMSFGIAGDERAVGYLKWLDNVVDLLKAKGKTVGFKPHPYDKKVSHAILRDDPRIDKRLETLDEAFEWADLAIAFTSNSLVEAFMAGVDVMPLHPTSLAWNVRSEIDKPRIASMDVKKHWLDTVATHQFTKDEIESGMVWEIIKKNI
jgi:hypothetical protein